MAEILPIVETLENRWMRAWIGGDMRTLKELTSRKFRMVMGTKPCAILDAKSWLASATDSFRCHSYRFGDMYAHDLGSVTVFATQMDIEASIDGHDWSGRVWVTTVWRKSGVRRKWRLVERIFSRPEEDQDIPAAIAALQLWRRPAKR